MQRYIFLSLCFLGLSVSNVMAGPLDFDNDGYSDIVYVKKSRKDGNWSYFSPQNGSTGTLGIFGKFKATPAPGLWGSTTNSSLVSVERVGKRKKARLLWSHRDENGGTRSIQFGSGLEQPLSGGDFNGNGYLDAAVVSNDGSFRILTDPFAPTQDASVQSVLLSENFSVTKKKKQPYPFFMRSSSGSAIPTSLTSVTVNGVPRYQLQSRSDVGLLSSVIPGFASRAPESVVTLKDESGEEHFLIFGKQEFLTDKKKRRVEVTLLSEDGITLYRKKFSKRATVLTGDFIDEPGEEVAIASSKRVIIVNPFTSVERSLAGFPGKAAGPVYVPLRQATQSKKDKLGPCDAFLPAPDGLNGFLAKNADHGGVVYLTPNGSYRNGIILHPKTLKEVSGTRYTGVANGGRGHFRIGGSLPFGEHVFSAETGGTRHCWRIPDGMSRVD